MSPPPTPSSEFTTVYGFVQQTQDKTMNQDIGIYVPNPTRNNHTQSPLIVVHVDCYRRMWKIHWTLRLKHFTSVTGRWKCRTFLFLSPLIQLHIKLFEFLASDTQKCGRVQLCNQSSSSTYVHHIHIIANVQSDLVSLSLLLLSGFLSSIQLMPVSECFRLDIKLLKSYGIWSTAMTVV